MLSREAAWAVFEWGGWGDLPLARPMQESSKIIILKLNNSTHRHRNSSLIMWPSNSHLNKSAVGLYFCSIMQRHTNPILHLCMRAFFCSWDPAVRVGSDLLLAGSRSGLLPPSANASNCMRQRRGVRLIQVVCAKAGHHDSQGQTRLGFAVSKRVRQGFALIWGLSVCWLLVLGAAPDCCPIFQLARTCPGPRPCGTLTLKLIPFMHISSLAAGTGEVTAKASPPASAFGVPFVSACPWSVSY